MKSVLVADDDPQVCGLLQVILEEAGYHPLTCVRGRAAIALAIEHRPDIAILDVNMPDLDGFAVCRALRANPLTKDIPILFLTARGDTPSELMAFASGAIDYMTKPFDMEVLLAHLRALLALYERVAAHAGSSTRPRTRAIEASVMAGSPHPHDEHDGRSVALHGRHGAPGTRAIALPPLDRDIIAGLSTGRTQQQIALAHGVGVRTIERRVRALKRRLNASTVPALVAQAASLGLLT